MNKLVALGMLVALGATTNGAANARGDAASLRSTDPQSSLRDITLVSVADPACAGGFGFRLAEGSAPAPDGRFVVPHDARFVASDIQWSAHAEGFDSVAGRALLEIGRAPDGSISTRPAARAIVNGTRVGVGEAHGARSYRTGITFGPGTTLCGHVRTREVLARAQPGQAVAVVRGHLVQTPQDPIAAP